MSAFYIVTNKTYSITRGLITLLVGVCFLLWPSSIAPFIVKIIAAFLLAIGLISLVFALNTKPQGGKGSGFLPIMNVIVYLVLGLLIFVFPNFFLNLLAILFGIVMLVAGISQIANLYAGRKYVQVSGGLYIIPIIITVCGLVLLFSPDASIEFLTILFGVALLLYGVSEFGQAWQFRNVKVSKDGKISGPIEDVKYEEVKDDK